MTVNSRWVRVACLVAMIAGLMGCAKNGMLLPSKQSEKSYHTPAQQEVLADAIQSAVSKINPRAFEGKRVYVEAIGVMPHTHTDLLDYIADSVRSQIANGGAQIVFPKSHGSILLPPDPDNVDFTLVVAVEAGGADNNLESSFLNFSGTRSLIAKARLRLSAYATDSGASQIMRVDGTAIRTYKRHVFWVWNIHTPYTPTSRPLL